MLVINIHPLSPCLKLKLQTSTSKASSVCLMGCVLLILYFLKDVKTLCRLIIFWILVYYCSITNDGLTNEQTTCSIHENYHMYTSFYGSSGFQRLPVCSYYFVHPSRRGSGLLCVSWLNQKITGLFWP